MRRTLLLVAALLVTVLLLRALTQPLAAQSVTPTPDPTPTAVGSPTVESTPTAVVESEAVSLLPQVNVLLSEQIKERVRARILAVILARMRVSNTEYTVMLPLVRAGNPMLSTSTPSTSTPSTSTPSTSTPSTSNSVTVTDSTEQVAASDGVSATAVPDVQAVIPTATPVPGAAPLPTPDAVARAAQVPILMYHYLSVPPGDADIYRRDLSVAPSLFAEHLDRLQAEGYTTIRLDDLLLNLTQGVPLPPKPVILTFDDGYRDNYSNAFPLLKERGMTATFFIVTDFIDEQRPEYLSWDMVREMYAGGMAIESHGRNHASLANRDDDYLIWQALGSLETIEYELGVRPRFVSYPAGEYDDRTIRIFQSAHYWMGLTTKQGATHSGDDLFQLRRVRVRGTTSAEDLARLVALDW